MENRVGQNVMQPVIRRQIFHISRNDLKDKNYSGKREEKQGELLQGKTFADHYQSAVQLLMKMHKDEMGA